MHKKTFQKNYGLHTGIRWPFYPERSFPVTQGVNIPINLINTDFFSNYIHWRHWFPHIKKQIKIARKEHAQ